jgi:myo-inositol-1(or 4)-monophosphatase
VRVPSEDPLVPELLNFAIAVAEEAGQLILDGLTRPRAEVDTKSTSTDMVTEMDRAAEALIRQRLRELRPDDGMMGEEGSHVEAASGVTWLVDPIDGTTNYVYRLPVFSVSVAAEVDGQVVAGVVRHPSMGETFSAGRGRGAFLNGRRLQVAGPPTLATALVGTGFSYEPERRVRQSQVVTRIIGSVRDVRRMGSAAIDLCWVACGRLDAYFERGLQPWDRGAGALIAAEAGAWVGRIGHAPETSGDVMACVPHLAAEFKALVDAAEADVATAPTSTG